MGMKEFDPTGKCGSCGHYKELPGTRTGRCQAKTDIPGGAEWCAAFAAAFGREIDPHPLVTRGQKKCSLYEERSQV